MSTLNVLYACDNNYAPYAGVSMFSLFENNRDIENITVYIMLENISDENLARLQRTADAFGRKLVVIKDEAIRKIDDFLKSNGMKMYRGSYTTYYRMFFDLVIPEDVTRLLYIDSDSVIPGSLKPLLELEMGENALAMTLESLGTAHRLNPDGTYATSRCNAGVALFDVKNWKKVNGNQMILDYTKNVRARYPSPNQDLQNIIFAGLIKILPPEYNFQPHHRVYSDKTYFGTYPRKDYYTEAELDHARQHPVILHTYRYLGDFPWHLNNYHPDTPIFDSYLRRSEWRDYVKKPANRGLAFKIEKILYRLLPRWMFLKMFRAYQKYSFTKQDRLLLAEEMKERNA